VKVYFVNRGYSLQAHIRVDGRNASRIGGWMDASSGFSVWGKGEFGKHLGYVEQKPVFVVTTKV